MFKMLICPKCKEVHQFKMVKIYTRFHGVTGEYIKSYLAQCNGCGRIIEVKNELK